MYRCLFRSVCVIVQLCAWVVVVYQCRHHLSLKSDFILDSRAWLRRRAAPDAFDFFFSPYLSTHPKPSPCACLCMHACVCLFVCVFVRMCSHAWPHMWLEQTPTLVALSVCPMQTFCECVPSSSQLKHRWSDSETARETPAKVRPCHRNAPLTCTARQIRMHARTNTCFLFHGLYQNYMC